MLCSKPHCNRGFKSELFPYMIRTFCICSKASSPALIFLRNGYQFGYGYSVAPYRRQHRNLLRNYPDPDLLHLLDSELPRVDLLEARLLLELLLLLLHLRFCVLGFIYLNIHISLFLGSGFEFRVSGCRPSWRRASCRGSCGSACATPVSGKYQCPSTDFAPSIY